MKSNKTVRKLFIVGEAVVLMMGVVLTWIWKSLPPQIPWFYSLPSGEQQLTSKVVLAGTVGGAAVLLIIIRGVAKWAAKEDVPVEITVMTGGVVAVMLLAAGFVRVIQIVIGL